MTAAVTTMELDQTARWIRRFAGLLHEQKEYLTSLDAAIGDADHGINMDRGFTAVVQKLDGTDLADVGALLKLVGSTLVSTVGGASGPLYGTAFLRMGAALAGKTQVGAADLGAALATAYEGMAARGKSSRGEKTVLDAFGPALDAFHAGVQQGLSLPRIAAASATAASEGARSTLPMVATKGRAGFLGEKSAGHQDPGATSAMYLFQALAETLQGSLE